MKLLLIVRKNVEQFIFISELLKLILFIMSAMTNEMKLKMFCPKDSNKFM